MNEQALPQIYRRALVLAAFILIVSIVVVWRLARLQVRLPGTSSTDPTPAPRVDFPAIRGSILDRNGYLLAGASTVYDLGATPGILSKPPAELADLLAPLLGRSREELRNDLSLDAAYVPLQRGLSASTAQTIASWQVYGLQQDPRPGRRYPHGRLAAAVLGIVTADGESLYGLEKYYDELLRGEDGFRRGSRDPLGSMSYQFHPAVDGATLILTLDRNVQYLVEDVLERTVVGYQAEKGCIIVMEPSTASILAMAGYPGYDPNRFAEAPVEVLGNQCISDHYEPGSVFKVLTVAAALDAGVVSPTSTYQDTGQIVVGGEVIKNSSKAAYGETSMGDLLAQSLNVGAAHVALKLGAFQFYDYAARFGIGRLTGVDLAYEVAGSMRLPGDSQWHESDLGTNSFGQGLAVTPLQMLTAIAAVANGGEVMRPHVVDRIVQGDKVTKVEPVVVGRAISREAAKQTTDLLVRAVDTLLTPAGVPGYRVAGKSGTSQIAVMGTYDEEDTVASFAGYLPAEDPRFAIIVVIHRPQKDRWGLNVAAPAFREIAQYLVDLYAVPPTVGV